jgi:hypothetical protein
VSAREEKLGAGELDFFRYAARPVIPAKGGIAQERIEAKEARDRPGAQPREEQASQKAYRADHDHQRDKALAR